MNKNADDFDMDEAFEDIFGDDTQDSDKVAVNDNGEKSSPAITSVKQVLDNGVWIFNHDLLLNITKDKEKLFFQGYNFIINWMFITCCNKIFRIIRMFPRIIQSIS